MAKIKYLETRRRASGKLYWVYNPPVSMKALIPSARSMVFEHRGDAEHHARHMNAEYDQLKREQRGQVHVDFGTVRGLVSTYKTTNAYTSLSENSRRTYSMLFEKAFDVRLGDSKHAFGDMAHSSVKPMHAEKLFAHLKEHVSDHRANHTIKVFRRVWSISERKGLTRGNPFAKMGLRTLPDRLILWSPEQVDLFVDTADAMGLWSIGTLALLCCDLAARPGDMRQLRWSNISDGVVHYVQEKTGEKIDTAIGPRLMERLEEATPSKIHDFIVYYEVTGRPYDRFMYYKMAAQVRDKANLPSHLQLRDLRRTGATELAESGVTEDELRSITGHRSRNILNTYVRPTEKLASNAMMKRFAGWKSRKGMKE